MWGLTFEKSLRMFSSEREAHRRTATAIRESLELMQRIEARLAVRKHYSEQPMNRCRLCQRPLLYGVVCVQGGCAVPHRA